MIMKKKVLAILLILVLSLGFLCNKPIVKYDSELSTIYKSAVESQSKGFYSSRLPIVPVYVSVEDMQDDRVYYTIHYFPFGSVGMSYSQTDGYNIEKELSRI